RALFDVPTTAAGPTGSLPLTEELLREAPSGDLFGWTQNAGMGWTPAEMDRREFLLLSTSGGIRNPDGSPVALGYPTGHWEVGLPAMMMALAAMHDLPCVLVPGGVTLPPSDGEDAGKIQTIGARFAHGQITLEQAAELGCKACASPGGGCQFLGTAATAQVV